MTKNLPVAKEGLPYILRCLVIGIVLCLFPFLALQVCGMFFFLLAACCAFFFRDPDRKVVSDPAVLVAPGDGKILEVSEEVSAHLGGKAKVVKIFLSLFDVHIQRSPVNGEVKKVEYTKGQFLDARHDLASSRNEQNAIVIENQNGKIIVKQVAGWIARKIDCWVRPGEAVQAGQRLGLIRFGSQVDLLFPENVEVCVSRGDRVIGGVSVVGILKGKPKGGPDKPFEKQSEALR